MLKWAFGLQTTTAKRFDPWFSSIQSYHYNVVFVVAIAVFCIQQCVLGRMTTICSFATITVTAAYLHFFFRKFPSNQCFWLLFTVWVEKYACPVCACMLHENVSILRVFQRTHPSYWCCCCCFWYMSCFFFDFPPPNRKRNWQSANFVFPIFS